MYVFFLHFRRPFSTQWYRMRVSHILIALLCFTNSILLANVDEDCGPDHYYDPVTSFCLPCSDCRHTSNIYCETACKGKVIGNGYGVILVKMAVLLSYSDFAHINIEPYQNWDGWPFVSCHPLTGKTTHTINTFTTYSLTLVFVLECPLPIALRALSRILSA